MQYPRSSGLAGLKPPAMECSVRTNRVEEREVNTRAQSSKLPECTNGLVVSHANHPQLDPTLSSFGKKSTSTAGFDLMMLDDA